MRESPRLPWCTGEARPAVRGYDLARGLTGSGRVGARALAVCGSSQSRCCPGPDGPQGREPPCCDRSGFTTTSVLSQQSLLWAPYGPLIRLSAACRPGVSQQPFGEVGAGIRGSWPAGVTRRGQSLAGGSKEQSSGTSLASDQPWTSHCLRSVHRFPHLPIRGVMKDSFG